MEIHMHENATNIPDEVLLRLRQIIGGGKNHQDKPLIPVARSTWFKWVKAGIAPPAVRLGPRAVAWRQSDITAFMQGVFMANR